VRSARWLRRRCLILVSSTATPKPHDTARHEDIPAVAAIVREQLDLILLANSSPHNVQAELTSAFTQREGSWKARSVEQQSPTAKSSTADAATTRMSVFQKLPAHLDFESKSGRQ